MSIVLSSCPPKHTTPLYASPTILRGSLLARDLTPQHDAPVLFFDLSYKAQSSHRTVESQWIFHLSAYPPACPQIRTPLSGLLIIPILPPGKSGLKICSKRTCTAPAQLAIHGRVKLIFPLSSSSIFQLIQVTLIHHFLHWLHKALT